MIKPRYSPGEITALVDQAIQDLESAASQVASGGGSLLDFEAATTRFSDRVGPATFMSAVSTEEAIRDEANEAEEKIGQFMVEIYTRKPLYRALKAFKPSNEEERRLHAETLREFEQNGLNLPDERLERVKELMKDLSRLETQFSKNLNEDKTAIELTEKELDGAQPYFLARLERMPSGAYRVTTQEPDYIEVMKHVTVSESRRKMLFAYLNRAVPENIAIFDQALEIRRKIAAEMGCANWAEYRLKEGRMAQSVESVSRFLNDLRGKLARSARADIERLQKMNDGAPLKTWDISYCINRLKKSEYSVDEEETKPYFPAMGVVEEMFRIYSELLGVEFAEVQADVWDPSVKLYSVMDKESREARGCFYADFFPREGKYGHAAAFTLLQGFRTPQGYSRPVSAIVSNFNPPSGDRPSLLGFSEVRTLFHEFGHIMHQVLTRAPFASLAGTAVAQDFVETPSQMLENWAWDAAMLKRISGHYSDRSKKLPDEMIARLLKLKNFMTAYGYTRQLLFGLFDLECHTSKSAVDTTELHDRIYHELFGLDSIQGGHMQASFGHLMGGYDAGYYGYLWSEVYSEDLFSVFKNKGLLDRELGRKYRQWILEPGNMREASELLSGFLGRAPSTEAFYQRIGI